jgi:hypothetical protein
VRGLIGAEMSEKAADKEEDIRNNEIGSMKAQDKGHSLEDCAKNPDQEIPSSTAPTALDVERSKRRRAYTQNYRVLAGLDQAKRVKE